MAISLAILPDEFEGLPRLDCPTGQNNESGPQANTPFRWPWNVSARGDKEFRNPSSFCPI
jgi:hypothetical protein